MSADILGAIANMGKGAWDIIQDGKAKAGAKSSFCSAVPKKVKFTELYGWKTQTGTWKRTWENFYGMDVIEYELVYSFQYNGQTDKAPGALFVNNFSVWARSCSVSWGFSLSVDASVKGNPINIGTKDKPIGSIPLLVSTSVNGTNAKGETLLLTAAGNRKFSVR